MEGEVRELIRRGRTLLARAAVVAEARGGGEFGTKSRSAPESVAPTHYGRSLHDAIAERFAGVRSLEDLRRAVTFAERALHMAQHSQAREPETVSQFRDRLTREHVGRHADEVARIEHVHMALVRLARKERGFDPLWGRPLSRRQRMFSGER